jgi:hypothetical protein
MELTSHNTIEGQSYKTNNNNNDLPIFPIADNDICKRFLDPSQPQPDPATDFCANYYDDSWGMVQPNINKPGWVYADAKNPALKHFQAFDVDGFYLQNIGQQQTENVYCWWDTSDRTVCQNGGTWFQQCGTPGNHHDCASLETPRLTPKDANSWRCSCLMQPGSNPPKPYKGAACQYSDAVTCNGNGVVDDNGNCTCNTGFTFPDCSFNCSTISGTTWFTNN